MAAIVITEFMDEEAIRGLLASHDVVYDPALVDRRDELLAAVAKADALIVRNRTRVDAALLDGAPKLKAVGRLGVGLDNIDVEACKARGIAVYPATGANDVAVVEWVIAAMLVLLRGAFAATGSVIAGEWPRTKLMGREADGQAAGAGRLRLHRPQGRRGGGGARHERLRLRPSHFRGRCGVVAALGQGDAVRSQDAAARQRRRLAARAVDRRHPQHDRCRDNRRHETRRHPDQCRARRRGR